MHFFSDYTDSEALECFEWVLKYQIHLDLGPIFQLGRKTRTVIGIFCSEFDVAYTLSKNRTVK